MMKVRCPHCEARLKVDDRHQGRTAPCPRCKGAVVLVSAEEVETIGAAAPRQRAHAEEPEASSASERDRGAAQPAGPSSYIDSAGADRVPLVIPTGNGDATYDLGLDDIALPEPVAPRRDHWEPPKKSKRSKQREIEDLKADGNPYLLKIRLLLLGLGLLMLAYNAYVYAHLAEDIAAFKVSVTSNPRAVVDHAKLEDLARSLQTAMTIEAGLYFTLGLVFCVLAVVIHKAPMIVTWAALVGYAGMWLVDLLVIQAMFGNLGVAMALFNFGTVIKIGIISGLWYGVQVGQAYQEQIVRPMRELSKIAE